MSLFSMAGARSETITPAKAIHVASNFANSFNNSDRCAVSIEPLIEYHASDNSIYGVRVSDRTVVIVSGDDRTVPVLGYFDSASLNSEVMPDGLRYLLDLYENEIRFMRESGAGGNPVKARREAGTAVSPLLGNITWDQTDPYNLLCPTYFGNKRSATGCAATALSQILGYWKWPLRGSGSVSYTPSTLPEKTIEVDFTQSVYDWEKIKPYYRGGETEEERLSVARLCFDAGAAMHMEYGEQSGALPEYGPFALTANFGYDGDLQMHYRQYFGLKQWEDLLHQELIQQRPVLFTGFSSTGGHTFVIDGCDGNGYFHVNWGWSGMSNGYFLLSALTPDTQGTGGSNGGFNYRQVAVTGIRPDGRTADAGQVPEIISNEPIRARDNDIDIADAVVDFRLGGKIENKGWKNETVDFAMALCTADGSEVMKVFPGKDNVAIESGKFVIGQDFKNIDLTATEPGTYLVMPLVRIHGRSDWSPVRPVAYNVPNYSIMTVKDGMVTFADASPYSIKAREFELHTPLMRALMSGASAEIYNDGDTDYNGEVMLTLLSADGNIIRETGEKSLVNIKPGESVKIEFHDAFSSDAGEYQLVPADNTGKRLCEPISVNLLSEPGGFSLLKAANQLALADAENVDKQDIRISADILATEYPFGGHVYVYIYDKNREKILGCLHPVYAFIPEGETAKIDFSGVMENGLDGETYTAVLVNGLTSTFIQPRDMASCSFRLKGNSGVDDVSGEILSITFTHGMVTAKGQGNVSLTLRSVDGSLTGRATAYGSASIEIPARGVVIATATDESGHTVTKKIIL